MNCRPVFLQSRRFLTATSIAVVSMAVGFTLADTQAANRETEPRTHIAPPPSSLASSTCQPEINAYALAYANYEAAYDLLMDAHYALEECQGGSQYKPSAKQENKLASMQSVLESH